MSKNIGCDLEDRLARRRRAGDDIVRGDRFCVATDLGRHDRPVAFGLGVAPELDDAVGVDVCTGVRGVRAAVVVDPTAI